MAVARIQDRTVEFRTVVQQAQRKYAQSGKGAATAQKKRAMMFSGGAGSSAVQQQQFQQQAQPLLAEDGHVLDGSSGAAASAGPVKRSDFARRAAEIGRGISATMLKLERLALLAKRKSMFDDKATEVNELTFVVKQNLAAINQQISGLQALSRQQQGKTEEGEHRKNVVFLLQDRLTGVSANFKEVLEVRTKNLQSTRARTDNFISQVSQNVPSSGVGGGSGGAAGLAGLHQQSASPFYASGAATATASGRSTPVMRGLQSSSAPPGLLDGGGGSGGGGGDLISLNPVVNDQQLLMMEEAQSSNSYIEQRGEAIEAIESTIAELGSIFGQLASMVSEQSEMIERIDANTEAVVDNVQGAQKELLKYWGRVSGNRWLVAKMFGVLMVFFLLWVLIAG